MENNFEISNAFTVIVKVRSSKLFNLAKQILINRKARDNFKSNLSKIVLLCETEFPRKSLAKYSS